ncbi:substrate-binding domain-containing protein [Micromonospora sp. LOL_024]|uniref:substrate-binding domain-containing protein n=1 Tax=Micromonospora sp. LOL_024 TaxID=3345412 RepID=UPI003A8BFC80
MVGQPRRLTYRRDRKTHGPRQSDTGRRGTTGGPFTTAGVSPRAEVFCPEWLAEHGYTAMRSLLDRPARPSAVICMNDRLAFDAYQALGEAGLSIPGDISVLSFDDDPIAAWLRPGLSTAALPHEQMGRRAVEILLDGEHRSRWLVPMPLRRRRSVAAPVD